MDESGKPIDPGEQFFSLAKASTIGLYYIESIGREIFTQNSKGGVILLGMFFYSSYIMAVICVYYDRDSIITGEGYATCGTITLCFIVMLRLIFYDGTGFDFLAAVVKNGQSGLAFLLLLYLIFNAIIILNGLIGIFGTAFKFEPEKIEEEIEEIQCIPSPIFHPDDEAIPNETNPMILQTNDLPNVMNALMKSEKLANSLFHEIELMKESIFNISQ